MSSPPSTIHCAGSQPHATLPPSPLPCLRCESPSRLRGSRMGWVPQLSTASEYLQCWQLAPVGAY
ncbi:hypothetical protein B0H19DRAFT_1089825, partial [Mycena capillaripes]